MTAIGNRVHFLLFLALFLLGQDIITCLASESIDGRYSFSLTTFDPSGKLAQVERASIAASLGTPIVAVMKKDRILLASPQILPSPLMQDDGTARFAPVSPHIGIAHSGISADGRALVAAAQRLAVEHAYTFDEAIPIDLFLEELSLLFQEYTMKPGARPFGAILLVSHLPPANYSLSSNQPPPQLFQINPSGSVIAVEEDHVVINGKFSSDLETRLKDLAASEDTSSLSLAEERQSLAQLLQEAITEKSPKETKGDKVTLPSTIISASLTHQGGLEIERCKLTNRS